MINIDHQRYQEHQYHSCFTYLELLIELISLLTEADFDIISLFVRTLIFEEIELFEIGRAFEYRRG